MAYLLVEYFFIFFFLDELVVQTTRLRDLSVVQCLETAVHLLLHSAYIELRYMHDSSFPKLLGYST